MEHSFVPESRGVRLYSDGFRAVVSDAWNLWARLCLAGIDRQRLCGKPSGVLTKSWLTICKERSIFSELSANGELALRRTEHTRRPVSPVSQSSDKIELEHPQNSINATSLTSKPSEVSVATETGMSIGTILGELITATGILRTETFDEAKIHSSQSGLPVGRVLVMSGHLGEGDLTSALQAAQMVREGKLTRRQATQALREAYNQCMPLEHVVDELLDYSPSTKLGELLVAAKILNISKLSKLELQARQSNLTLGQILTRCGIISIALLSDAVQLLILMRSNQLSFTQAADALYACCSANLNIDAAIERIAGGTHCDLSQSRIGHLLQSASVITDEEQLLAAEMGIECSKTFGEVLVEYNVVEPYVLESAVSLQSMLVAGSLSQQQVTDLLKQVIARKCPLPQVLEELHQLKTRVVALLKSAVLINDDDIAYALRQFPAYADDTARALIAARLINLPTVRKTVHCLKLIQAQQITEDMAAVALRHSNRRGVSIEDALNIITTDRPCTLSTLGLKIVEAVQEHWEQPPPQLSSFAV